MGTPITLLSSDVSYLRNLTQNGTTNFVAGYAFIKNIVDANPAIVNPGTL